MKTLCVVIALVIITIPMDVSHVEIFVSVVAICVGGPAWARAVSTRTSSMTVNSTCGLLFILRSSLFL